MDLFKRILLSLFPENIVNQPINPASMFISFVSPKQFFSVINRKIVENYKLNLFDVSLDSFEVKIWFGDQPTIKVKDIDFYYWYWVVSNLNWYRFLSPSNLWTCISLVSSIYLKNVFSNYNYKYFINFVIWIYLLTFVFASRIKVFPHNNDKDNYKWFIDTFFEFYHVILEQIWDPITQDDFNSMKNNVLKDIEIFFMLYYFYKRINNIFDDKNISEKEYYSWLFYDELKKWNYKFMVNDFIDNYATYSRSNKFSLTEKNILNIIFPADILIKYLFDQEDIFQVVDNIVVNLYDRDVLDNYLKSFLKSEDSLSDFLDYITNYQLYKDNYFKWIKKLSLAKFTTTSTYEEEQEIDELMSQVWQWDNIENVKIPERIKKESALVERLINFYITFVWWFWIERWDNFYLKFYKKDLLNSLLKPIDISSMKHDMLFFYWWHLYNYSKNVFYYKYAFENVRAGKEKFSLPFKSTFKEVYQNLYILKLFNETFLASILQDINQKDIKVYLQNKDILTLFKLYFGKEISSLVKSSKEKFLSKVYLSLDNILSWETNFIANLILNLNEKDIKNLKESIYTLDFWIWNRFIEMIDKFWINLCENYTDNSIFGISSIFRDTIFGFVLYYTFLKSEEIKHNTNFNLSILKKIYIIDVLWISENYVEVFDKIIDILATNYNDLLEKWIKIDNNIKYFLIWLENWMWFIDNKDEDKLISEIWWEDVIWFRWYIKNITFYNKRYLIPKD